MVIKDGKEWEVLLVEPKQAEKLWHKQEQKDLYRYAAPEDMVENGDVWTMLLSTVRYALGRKTYMSFVAPELVVKYSKFLSEDQLQQIADEIDRELCHAERRNVNCGMDMDHNEWRSGVRKIKNCIIDRQNEG